MAEPFKLEDFLEEEEQPQPAADTIQPITFDSLFEESPTAATALSTEEIPEEVQEFEDPLGPLETFGIRAGDNIITRPLVAGAEAIGEAGARGIASLTGSDREPQEVRGPFESKLPLEDIPESRLSAAVLGDIFGETLTGAIAAQQLAQRLGPVGRNPLLQGGAAFVGGAAAAARSTPQVLRASRAIQNARALSTSAAEEAIKSASSRRLGTLVDDFVYDAAELAVDAPGTFIAAELLPFSTAATTGLAFAEGTEGDRDAEVQATAIGALVGSIVSPVVIARGAVGGTKGIVNSAKNFIGNVTKSGAEKPKIRQQAAESLTQIAESTGLSMEEVLRTIDNSISRAASIDDALGQAAETLPVGNLTGMDFLVALQRQASRQSRKAAGNDKLNTEQFFKGLGDLELTLRADGDPQALIVAADLRKQYFDTLLQGRVARAREQAISSLDVVAGQAGTPGADLSDVRRGASKRTVEALQGALREARATETELYSSLGRGISYTPEQMAPLRQSLNNAEEALQEFAGELPDLSTLRRVAAEGAEIPFFMRVRTRAMNAAARMESNQQTQAASDVRRFIVGPLTEIMESTNIPELQVAREFSTQLNEAFTKSAANRFLAKDRNRALKINPESALGALTRASGDDAVIQFDSIVQAGRFGDRSAAFRNQIQEAGTSRTQLRQAVEANDDILGETVTAGELRASMLGFDDELGTTIMRETDMFIRALANEFRVDGQVDVTRLSAFVRNNNSLIDKFPSLKEDLSNARTAGERIRRVERSNTTLTSPTATRRMFGGLINKENPTPVLQKTIASPSRGEALQRLVVTAKRAEEGIGENAPLPGAIDGLRTTILDAAYMNSKRGKQFRWDTYRDSLFSPPAGEGKALADEMVDLGIMTTEQRGRLKEMLDIAAQTQTAMDNPTELAAAAFGTGKSSPWREGAFAVAGSAVGGALAKQVKGFLGVGGGTGDIVANQRGAQAFKNFFVKRGDDEVTELMMEATSNAKLFKSLMEEFDPLSLDQASNRFTQLSVLAASAGFSAFQETTLQQEFDDAFDLPEIPEGVGQRVPIPEEEQEPDFFDQLSGGQ